MSSLYQLLYICFSNRLRTNLITQLSNSTLRALEDKNWFQDQECTSLLSDCIPSTVNVELTQKNCSYFSSRLSFQRNDWQQALLGSRMQTSTASLGKTLNQDVVKTIKGKYKQASSLEH